MTTSAAYLHRLREAIVDHSNNSALLELQHLATSSNPYAQYLLGEMYCFGEGIEVNYEESLKWLCLASDAGSSEGMFILAKIFDPSFTFNNNSIESKRVIKSQKIADLLRKTAFEIFMDRAKKGDISVAKWLSQCYQLGWGVEADLNEYLEWDSKTTSVPYPTST